MGHPSAFASLRVPPSILEREFGFLGYARNDRGRSRNDVRAWVYALGISAKFAVFIRALFVNERVGVDMGKEMRIFGYISATRTELKYCQSQTAPQPGRLGGATSPFRGTGGLNSPISRPSSSREPPGKYS